MPSKYCYIDGPEVVFFESKGRTVGPNRWQIECPQYSYGIKIIVDARSVYSTIVGALDEVLPSDLGRVTRVHMRPHQAVGLFLEKFLTAQDIKKARDRDDYIELGPVKVEGNALTICVYRELESNVSVILADANGEIVNEYLHRPKGTIAN